jgi:hypothetical protein
MKILISWIFILSLLMFISCSRESEDEKMTGGSHNTGKNCLGCHSNFKLAGSVYNKGLSSPLPGVTIKVTSQANGAGTVLATLTSDANGNFHTGSAISFTPGVYVSASVSGGTVKNMGGALTSGACNSCHGSSASKIWAE